MTTTVPVVWHDDLSDLADAALALTKLRTQPVSAAEKRPKKNHSGGSARSGELSPTTPALEAGISPFCTGNPAEAPAPTPLTTRGGAVAEALPDAATLSDDDESPRHEDGEISGAYGRSRSWTREEDEQVRRLVAEHGLRKWALIASCLGTKSQKQVYARYRDYLAPSLVDSVWTPEEHARLFELHAELGNRWSEIAKLMPGRSPNAIKNRYNACLRKKQRHASRGHGQQDMEIA